MCTIGTVTKNKPSLLCPNSKLYIPSNLSWLVDGKRCSSRLISICFDAVVPSIEFDSVLFMENWKRNDVLMGSNYCAKCSVLCSRPDREQWRRPMRWRNAVFKWRTRSGTMRWGRPTTKQPMQELYGSELVNIINAYVHESWGRIKLHTVMLVKRSTLPRATSRAVRSQCVHHTCLAACYQNKAPQFYCTKR